MKFSFRRVISKGSFIPEIDGLRFIAIVSVVLYHLNWFLIGKDKNSYEVEYNFDIFNWILSVGHLGVPLFFVISGFILAKPFAKMHMTGGSAISLKSYFIRRLTRLEPPYILIMTILLFGMIYVSKKMSVADALASYLASITYTHNIVFGTFARLNAVAWSLEIEIQFYLLMPLLAKIYMISDRVKRRVFIIGLALFFMTIDTLIQLPFISIINYFEYFLIGLLLADFIVSGDALINISKNKAFISTLIFLFIWIAEMFRPDSILTGFFIDSIQLFSIFIFYYLVLVHRSIKILANPIITNIGGMCYTIYLLHYPIVSMLGNPLSKIIFSTNELINSLVYSAILLIAISVASAIFFLLVERPFMDKNWYKKIWRSKKPTSIELNRTTQLTRKAD